MSGSPIVGTHRRHQCMKWCARGIVQAHRPYTPVPLQRKPQCDCTGGIVRISRCHKQPAADREMTNATGGATNNQLWLWFSPPTPKCGKAYARRTVSTGGANIISDEGVRGSVDRVGAFDDMSEGAFRLQFSLSPCTTVVAHETRSSKPDSTTHVDRLGLSTPSSGGSGPRIVEIAA
jgi:hypothetical protein